mmetsp:Transcript_132412/g.264160  ORF Transcript_132412/g.264160 Transcript_132412/m.264160 type:complete len:221 (+) Transcript_132412:1379-2041(+)
MKLSNRTCDEVDWLLVVKLTTSCPSSLPVLTRVCLPIAASATAPSLDLVEPSATLAVRRVASWTMDKRGLTCFCTRDDLSSGHDRSSNFNGSSASGIAGVYSLRQSTGNCGTRSGKSASAPLSILLATLGGETFHCSTNCKPGCCTCMGSEGLLDCWLPRPYESKAYIRCLSCNACHSWSPCMDGYGGSARAAFCQAAFGGLFVSCSRNTCKSDVSSCRC